MKKLLLVASVVLMGVAVSAQETRFGVKAGYSMSTLKVDGDQDDLEERSTDPSHTFYVGGLVEHKFSDTFGIQGELLYSPLGGKEDYNVSEGQLYFREKSKLSQYLSLQKLQYIFPNHSDRKLQKNLITIRAD